MDRNSPYYKQVSLLIRTVPFVAAEDCFALKGGTAINLFVHNFPRLSIDIDLAYLPMETRADALANIRIALGRIVETINQAPDLSATIQDNKPDEMRIIVNSTGAQIKIEVSPVARGVLHPPVEQDVAERVEDEFGFASIKVLSLADLYGGKLCAALDRQHPRDLFDVKTLLETQGIDRGIFDGFITYLLSHNRPMSEIMKPRWKDITEIYNNEFLGMTFETVSLDELKTIPEKMISALKSQFTQKDFDFLKSIKEGAPNWDLAPNEKIQHFPAVKWKLINIQKMPEKKHKIALSKLEEIMLDWI
jgi:predicted nucleotidyltransferase component of viral defense system